MSGRVELTWQIDRDRLILHWSERGGPAPQQPASPGFGIRVIGASIERQLDGEACFEWRPEGLHCSLSVPCGDAIGQQARAPGAHRMVGEDRRPPPLRLERGSHVLLVEDEILVAMMMRDLLAELGFSVVGPFSRLSEAMVAAVHDEIDAGIIDVNLGGEFVYPVADVLAARRIPFVFVTGYGVESIERRFGNVPIIKKPVQRQSLQKVFAECGPPGKGAKGRFAAVREELRRVASAGPN
jgi:CheY-like chemotaxis protein